MEDPDIIESKLVFDLLLKDGDAPFSGWDFSHIENRMVTAPLTWSYNTEIIPHIRTVNSMLDMGTGGGELLSILGPFPPHTCATESYKPNVIIAEKRLKPLGIDVIQIKDDGKLPFEDGEFNLIINRHEFYSEQEVYRVLSSDGYFITQQVGERNDDLIREILGYKKENEPWPLKLLINKLESFGFEIITKKECFPVTRVFDIGAIVFYLKAIPWEIPSFTVEKYYDKLWEVHNVIQDNGYIDVISHRYFIKAHKI